GRAKRCTRFAKNEGNNGTGCGEEGGPPAHRVGGTEGKAKNPTRDHPGRVLLRRGDDALRRNCKRSASLVAGDFRGFPWRARLSYATLCNQLRNGMRVPSASGRFEQPRSAHTPADAHGDDSVAL